MEILPLWEHPLWNVVGLTLMAGLAMPLGGVLAMVEHIHNDWLEQEFRHGVMAIGAGALLSAVALVLVPEGRSVLSLPWVMFCFMAGGLLFMWLDRYLAARNSESAQLVAMLADFVPEALALGATLASGSPAALLLAMVMVVQNIPEGFNACRELSARSGASRPRILIAFMLLSLLGPLAGLAGYFWLVNWPELVGAVMLFASGGILYLVFQDIAPQIPLKKHWAPPMGAVAGFLVGVTGQMLIGHGG
ncbi:MAG: divalent cation transporter [Marinobacterium sp.]|nr:divalent cation transporter [Marinobacterium sp.]